jgi:hypothetical protein
MEVSSTTHLLREICESFSSLVEKLYLEVAAEAAEATASQRLYQQVVRVLQPLPAHLRGKCHENVGDKTS